MPSTPVENVADRDERIVHALERIGDILEAIEDKLEEMLNAQAGVYDSDED